MTLSPYSVTDLILAIATVIYTFGTFLLWWTTKRNTDLLAEQLNLLITQSNQQAAFNETITHNSILDAHREIWLTIIENHELLSILNAKCPPDDKLRIQGEFLGSILINHCARIHIAYQEGIFNYANISAFERDAQYLFSFPLVKWRWKNVMIFHRKDFVTFIRTIVDLRH